MRLPLLGVAVGLALIVPTPAPACSICRCGDPTFNALGLAGYTSSGLSIALDWERFDKSEGDPSLESESQVENRLTGFASYGFGQRYLVALRVPYSLRSVTETAAGEETETVDTNGFSDPEIYGQALLWASTMSDLGSRASVAVGAGVKTPWGENDVARDGERVDEHAQPGTGSTDLFGNVTLLYLIDMQSSLFASTGYRRTGENEFGYRYGSTFLANISYERKFGRHLDGLIQFNFRDAAQDRVDSDGTLGENSGGSLLYATPMLLLDITKSLVVRAGVQIPIIADLNGEQTERAVVNVGVTDFFSY
jgi:hypothetical protein